LASLAPQPPSGFHQNNLASFRAEILCLLQDCVAALDRTSKDQAVAVIVAANKIEDRCDSLVAELISSPDVDIMAPAYVLSYRYNKRMASHCRNIASSIVQPVHKLDFTSKIIEQAEEDAGAAEE
jgi:phosphate uptake regulator